MSVDQRDLILISKPARSPLQSLTCGLDVPHGCSVFIADGYDGNKFQHRKHALGSDRETLTRKQTTYLVKKCYQEGVWLMLQQRQDSMARTSKQTYSRLQDILDIPKGETTSEKPLNESDK